ncbi:uncharacterized protein LOC125537305 isoform X2 [Triticum urartu]|uniref:uncharacterized protein LOC125537305 isoform X2 n=1 Tax=Triticum urartu TaxID=4572 RepID=UPI0020441EE7|nr:uncharacterized protein LOC125537305 isoform X2 [Triticum urartu]
MGACGPAFCIYHHRRGRSVLLHRSHVASPPWCPAPDLVLVGLRRPQDSSSDLPVLCFASSRPCLLHPRRPPPAASPPRRTSFLSLQPWPQARQAVAPSSLHQPGWTPICRICKSRGRPLHLRRISHLCKPLPRLCLVRAGRRTRLCSPASTSAMTRSSLYRPPVSFFASMASFTQVAGADDTSLGDATKLKWEIDEDLSRCSVSFPDDQ